MFGVPAVRELSVCMRHPQHKILLFFSVIQKVFDRLLLPVVLCVGFLSYLPAALGSVLVFMCFA